MSQEIQKKYYSITEVADMLKLSASQIRFYESEFPTLKPKKNKKGDRQFTQKDIDQLKIIYELVKVKGFTLQGAKDIIKSKENITPEKEEIINSLEQIKNFLIQLRDKL